MTFGPAHTQSQVLLPCRQPNCFISKEWCVDVINHSLSTFPTTAQDSWEDVDIIMLPGLEVLDGKGISMKSKTVLEG